MAHEVAHLIAHQLFGPRIRPHGEEWQLIMRGIYGLPPDRCHTYAVKRRATTRYLYRCHCPEHNEFPFSRNATPWWPRAPLLPALQGDPGIHRRSAPRVIQAMAPAAFSSAIRSAE